MASQADVTGRGAVLLGSDFSCDGFYWGRPARVQTHIHEDHMDGFDTSKGEQHIYCSKPTKALLIVDQDADLPYRSNLIDVDYGSWTEVRQSRFMLVENGHMLGSAQVAVELTGGLRVGYSGDFAGGVENPIQVDALVLDGTCGAPKLVRQYTQELAEERLREIVSRALSCGAVYIRAARGTLQRALTVLAGNVNYPVLGSDRLLREVAVYRAFGQPIDELLSVDSAAGTDVLDTGRYVRAFGRRDRIPVDTSTVTVIELSAYVPSSDPVVEHSRQSYRVAITNHADFEETLDYVHATGACEVITDATRSPHARALAQEIATRLGVTARPSSSENSLEWGN